MPGVADAERRTRLVQEQRDRAAEREHLLRLVKEGRLYEADEHQLETIKLALELNQLLDSKKEAPPLDAETLAQAIKSALSDIVIPTVQSGGNADTSTPSSHRPQMRHVDLTTIKHGDSGIQISHDDTLAQDKEGDGDAADKLQRLRELKGRK